ncbi:MAG: prephenate dehydrogenase/arogenate dehydrogenase family protein [Pseudomonadota bacterium]
MDAQVPKPDISSVALLGGCGGFGRAFKKLFADSDITTTTIDVVADADVMVDMDAKPEHFVAAVSNHDLVLVCLPEAIALQALELIESHNPAGVELICDICSVKSNICGLVTSRSLQMGYVSIHPMFGPDRGFVGQNLVFIDVLPGALNNAWKDLLKSWHLQVLDADADTHDQVASMVQVLTHATLVSFAEAQSQLDVPEELFDAMTTPIFRALDETAQGMLHENPALYHNIQTANPHGSKAREALQSSVNTVIEAMGQEQPGATKALFNKLARD